MTDRPENDGQLMGGLAAKLRGLATQGRELDIAQFQFVGFEEIAQAYGEKWHTQQERVKDIAHAFIRRRLGERDILVRGADGFLIVYADGDTEQARSHAVSVKTDLNAFYLGEGATKPPVEVAVSHQRLPVQDLIQSLSGMSFSTADDQDASADLLEEIEWKFQPVWHAQREAVFNYYVAPVLKKTGSRVPGYQFDMDLDREFDFLRINEIGLQQSETAIRKLAQTGERSMLGASIHSSSLLKLAGRNRLFSVIDRFGKDLLRYRVVQISATPPGFPRMYLEEIYNGLKQRVPNIAISLAWNETDIRSVLKLKPAAVGFTVSPWALTAHSTISHNDLFGKVRQAAEMARSAKIPFYFDGEAGPDLVRRTREAGVDMISSPLVWPLVGAPVGTHSWPSERLAA